MDIDQLLAHLHHELNREVKEAATQSNTPEETPEIEEDNYKMKLTGKRLRSEESDKDNLLPQINQYN